MIREKTDEAKSNRDFDAADEIRNYLLSEFNVAIDDRLREYSVGGNFGLSSSKKRMGDAFVRRGGGDLTPEQEAEIVDLVEVRAQAKKKRDFNAADELRDILDTQFSVKVDDKSKFL